MWRTCRIVRFAKSQCRLNWLINFSMVSFKTTLAEEVVALLEGGADLYTLSKQWHFPKSVETPLNAQFDASQCIWAQVMLCLLALVVYRVMRQRLNGGRSDFSFEKRCRCSVRFSGTSGGSTTRSRYWGYRTSMTCKRLVMASQRFYFCKPYKKK